MVFYNSYGSYNFSLSTEITCPILGTPPFGEKSVCGNKLGSKCKFTCNEGYVMVKGNSLRVCRGKGEWDGIDPLCSREYKI